MMASTSRLVILSGFLVSSCSSSVHRSFLLFPAKAIPKLFLFISPIKNGGNAFERRTLLGYKLFVVHQLTQLDGSLVQTVYTAKVFDVL